MARINDEPALVLHSRPYRETSLLLDLLTLNHGRVGAVLKGQRRGAARGGVLLSVFASFSASWFGRGGLVTLAQPEAVQPRWLTGRAAAGGFYITELLVRVLREREPMPALFAMACYTLDRCAEGESLRIALRPFEWQLLEELGLRPDLTVEADGATPIASNGDYWLRENGGFERASPDMPDDAALLPGTALHAIDRGEFDEPLTNRAAQQLFRQLISPALGSKPLRSRELFKRLQPERQESS